MCRKPRVLAFACFLFSLGLRADTAQTIVFLASLSPQNVVPPTNLTGRAWANVLVHQVRDSSGALKSGSVEFGVTYEFPSGAIITGLQVHSGAAGQNGPVVLAADISSTANSITVGASGTGGFTQDPRFGAAGQAVMQDVLANPQNYYVQLDTSQAPAGAVRGQLLPVQRTVLIGLMNPRNETPPVASSGASAVAQIRVLRSLDSSGNLAAANVVFDVNYSGFPNGTTFTGMHIHSGPAGVAGPITISTGIGSGASSVAAAASGSGSLHYQIPVLPSDSSFTAEAATVNGMFTNPNAYYINLHTTVNPSGEVRSQLLSTDSATLQTTLLPQNETPPLTGLAATAPTAVSVYTLRNPDGTVAAGAVLFDVDAIFPAAQTFTELKMYSGTASSSTPEISLALGAVVSENGLADLYRWVTVSDAAGVRVLNSLVQNPASVYVNVLTTDHTGGAAGAQLAGTAGAPSPGGVASASSTVLAMAPGSIISVYGQNLSPLTTDLTGFYQISSLPVSMNGVTVTIGGVKAPVYFVSPGQLNIEVPFEVKPGPQSLVVTTAAGSATTSVNVAAQAPSIFVVDNSKSLGAVVKSADFSLVAQNNPVTAGDTIVVYSTGLGQTTPAVATGTLVVPPGNSFNNTAAVTASIGGRSAPVAYSIASPDFTGLYQTAVTVPPGVAGTAPLVLSIGSQASNSVNLAVQ